MDFPSKPPNDAAHVDLFRDLAREHLRLMELYPAPDVVKISDDGVQGIEYWNRVIRASSMRKFMLKQRTLDNVYLPVVFDALERLIPTPPDTVAGFLPSAREAFKATVAASSFVEIRNGGPAYTVPQMLEDLVYGVLLHGDYGRHKRVQSRHRFNVNEQALMVWLIRAEDLLEQVLGCVDELEARGLIGAKAGESPEPA